MKPSKPLVSVLSVLIIASGALFSGCAKSEEEKAADEMSDHAEDAANSMKDAAADAEKEAKKAAEAVKEGLGGN